MLDSNMSRIESSNKRPLVDKVKAFIGDYTDLKYDGAKIICLICDKPLMCWSKTDCRKHVNTLEHTNKKRGVPSTTQFKLDLTCMFQACNLPFVLVEQQPFLKFWHKYNPHRKLPTRATLRSYVPAVREGIENKIKSELAGKYLWLSVGDRKDIKKNCVVNVIVRVLDPFKSSPPLLLASKRVEKCSSEVITKLVLDTLKKFNISPNQLLMFVDDGSVNNGSVGCSLKKDCSNMLHITCKIHDLHLVTKTIQRCYPVVDELVANTKATFGKSALYYNKYFKQIKPAVLEFYPKRSRINFDYNQVETDLETIQNNYLKLYEAMEKLQNPAISLRESLRIIQGAHSLLSDAKNDSVLTKFETVLNRDSDFITLRQICDGSCPNSLINFKDYFNYVNVTSVDVTRSFSAYKSVFSSQRTSFTESSVEAYLMMQFFLLSHPFSGNQATRIVTNAISASLALSEWCLRNRALLKNKTILELGAGVGLTGLVVALNCEPKKYNFTDCHSTVLKTLRDNISLNFNSSDNTNNIVEVDVINLSWENVQSQSDDFKDIEIVLAADVVYDSSLFDCLYDALKCFLSNGRCEEVYMSCTERNLKTLAEFLAGLEKSGLNYEEISSPQQEHFCWSTEVPVRLFRIGKRCCNN
ncbi:hepatocellular carcinoma-associated antigen [Holotrichia oblita]|uniref:Hepatocellular carcinoma-associated antigen n=1 Tax=Holotrichia oblita TaxID=644536 RepID=A0ACB9T603_HOLOL|nr:hepatocellular carcinoma-associated antigen [Holotrichia oblita]